MTTMFLSFLFMLVMVAGMAIGVMFGRKPIAGSCGGMKALGLDMQCEICGGDPAACDSRKGAAARDDLGLAREAVRGKRTL
jgi:hypothetical protein